MILGIPVARIQMCQDEVAEKIERDDADGVEDRDT
jgi:hypothetical protein